MARISTYQIDPVVSDLDLLIGTDKDNPGLITKNFALSGIAEYVIDKLIDPDATDFHIPVFRSNGNRITDSIMVQNAYPNGSLISVLGSFSVCCGSTLYGNNYLGADETQETQINSKLYLLGPIYDSNGTLGSSEQVLVSNELGELAWENYQGTGLEFQSTWDAAGNLPDLTAISLVGGNTGKYWVVSIEGGTDLGGITDWKIGDWAIIAQDNDDNVFWEKIDNSSVDGVGTPEYISKWTGPKTLGDSGLKQIGANEVRLINGPHFTSLGLFDYSDEATGALINSSYLASCYNHELPLQFVTTKNVVPEGNVPLVRMTILPNTGNVGIGTNSPTQRLEVAGNIKLSGALYNDTGSSGTAGQLLSSGGAGAGFNWVDPVVVPADNITGFAFAGKYAVGGSTANTINAGGDPTADQVYKASIESSYTSLGAQGPGFVPTSTTIQHYDAGNNEQGDYVFSQPGTLTIGQSSSGNGGRLVINQSGFTGATNHRLNVGGDARIEGRVNITAGGLCVSNNPSGISLDNTSMVIGSGDNDIISGSDHSIIVGKGNQLTQSAGGAGSDQSAAIGSLNVLTDASNSLAVGRANSLIGTGIIDPNGLRSQVIGLNNRLKDTFSSVVIGGQNVVNISETNQGQNTHVFGYDNKIYGYGDNVYAIGNKIDLNAGGGASNFYAFGSNINLDKNVHGSDTMAIGIRNKATLSYTPQTSIGLGYPALIVGAGSTAGGDNDALIITRKTDSSATNPGSRIILPDLVGFNFANDSDAASAGIPTGGLYRNGNELRINFNNTEAPGNEGLTTLTPHFQIATPGGSDTYTQLNNIVDFDWISGGGSGIYEYILPSATAVPYRKIRFVNNSTITASTKVHITAPTGETIDGGAFYEISKPYNGCAVWSDGVQWIVIQAKAN
jgi:hypothetical protein